MMMTLASVAPQRLLRPRRRQHRRRAPHLHSRLPARRRRSITPHSLVLTMMRSSRPQRRSLPPRRRPRERRLPCRRPKRVVEGCLADRRVTRMMAACWAVGVAVGCLRPLSQRRAAVARREVEGYSVGAMTMMRRRRPQSRLLPPSRHQGRQQRSQRVYSPLMMMMRRMVGYYLADQAAHQASRRRHLSLLQRQRSRRMEAVEEEVEGSLATMTTRMTVPGCLAAAPLPASSPKQQRSLLQRPHQHRRRLPKRAEEVEEEGSSVTTTTTMALACLGAVKVPPQQSQRRLQRPHLRHQSRLPPLPAVVVGYSAMMTRRRRPLRHQQSLQQRRPNRPLECPLPVHRWRR